jgi:hypothetical protein
MGTFRTITTVPGCPHAARNAGGTFDRAAAGELPQAAAANADSAMTAMPAHAAGAKPRSLFMKAACSWSYDAKGLGLVPGWCRASFSIALRLPAFSAQRNQS